MATSTPNYGLKKFESGDPPDLPSLAASMDKIDTELKKNENAAATNATNIGLFTEPTLVTWDSDDRIWHEKPSGRYWYETGLDGYPDVYCEIIHLVSGPVVSQIMVRSVRIAFRRFTSTQSMDWKNTSIV